MNAADNHPEDQRRLEAILLAYDEALADGTAVQDESEFNLPADLDSQLRGMQLVLHQLDHLRRDRLYSAVVDGDASSIPTRAAVPEGVAYRPIEGQHVGRFELVRELGRGGHGVVFLANDRQIGRRVALKIPRPEVLVGEDTRRRFVREGQAAGGLAHPNLIPVYEVGEDGPFCYLATAYCDGPTLTQWLRDYPGQVPEQLAARLIKDLAGGVQHAHERGVWHRDIKPSNVLLEPTGDFPQNPGAFIPRLTDFGLAKITELSDGQTRSGMLLGTPAYMSPEQAESRLDDVGPATDVYALGVLLYEILAGHPPFRGQSDVQTLQLVARGDVPRLRHIRPQTSRDLEAITLKCLEKSPSKRYASAALLADDLGRFLNGQPTVARPASSAEQLAKWCRRRPAMAALLSVVAATAVTLFAVIVAYNIRLGEEASRAEREAESSRRLLYTADVRLAYEILRANNVVQAIEVLDQHIPVDGKEDLREYAWYYLREQCEPPVLTLAGHEGAVMAVAFSPDGQLLASGGSDGSTRLWDAATGTPRRILRESAAEVTCLAFSPTGSLLAAGSDDHAIHLWNSETGEKLQTLTGHDDQVMTVAFSPDGRTLASGSCDATVRIWDAATAEAVATLTGATDVIRSVAFSPDGELLFAVDEGGALHHWRTGNWQRLASDTRPKEKYFAVTVSRSGRRIAAGGRREVINLWEPANGQLNRLEDLVSGHTEWIQSLAFSPLDDSLASAGKDCVLRLWKPGETKSYRTLLGHQQRVWSVAWSPDGQQLASGGADGVVKIWSLLDDQGKPHVLSPSTTSNCVFSPDGSLLGAFSGDGVVRVWNVATGAQISEFPAHDHIIYELQFAPDNSLIASRDAQGVTKVWSRDPTKLLFSRDFAANASSPLVIDPTGRNLATTIDEQCTVAILDIVTGEILQRFPHQSPINRIRFTPNGRYLITCNQSLQIWDIDTGVIVYSQSRQHDALAVAGNGRHVAAAAGSNITLLDLTAGVHATTLVTSGADVTSLAISPDGLTLAAGLTQPSTVSLWDIRTRRMLMQLDCDVKRIMDVTFSWDGRCLLATGDCPDEQSAVWSWKISNLRQGQSPTIAELK